MDKPLRQAIETATQAARAALEADYREQLGAGYDIRADGTIGSAPPKQLDARGRALWRKLVAAVLHRKATARSPAEAVAAWVREAAFTTLNRFVAFKMLELRGLVPVCVTGGDQSQGFKEFVGLAPGLDSLPDRGYRLFIESLCDEVAREVRVLFDRDDPASLLWPSRNTLRTVLGLLSDPALAPAWSEDETIGWVYQYFNSGEERKKMRDVKQGGSQAPRDSHELAVRNQFFTPRYVVEFLVDNTLGRTWWEMRKGRTALHERCRYLVRPPDEPMPERALKDPREIRVLDPACGSGHFLLYAFDLLEVIYREAWEDGALRDVADDEAGLARAVPGLILKHNLHGVDIDPRAAQIAALALWMRAQRAMEGIPRAQRPRIERTNVVVAEPIPFDADMALEVANRLPFGLRTIFHVVLESLQLAGDAGTLLRPERMVQMAIDSTRRALASAPRQVTFDNYRQVRRDIEAAELWDQAEDEIGKALRDYAKGAADAAGLRRRMFRHDTAQGLAFIEVCQQEYDVVLMNPPFGAASLRAKAWIGKAYPRSKNDLLACFVERGVESLVPKGKLGAISSRTAFFLSRFADWRESVILGLAPPALLADLGTGVLDGAAVETAAYVLERA